MTGPNSDPGDEKATDSAAGAAAAESEKEQPDSGSIENNLSDADKIGISKSEVKESSSSSSSESKSIEKSENKVDSNETKPAPLETESESVLNSAQPQVGDSMSESKSNSIPEPVEQETDKQDLKTDSEKAESTELESAQPESAQPESNSASKSVLDETGNQSERTESEFNSSTEPKSDMTKSDSTKPDVTKSDSMKSDVMADANVVADVDVKPEEMKTEASESEKEKASSLTLTQHHVSHLLTDVLGEDEGETSAIKSLRFPMIFDCLLGLSLLVAVGGFTMGLFHMYLIHSASQSISEQRYKTAIVILQGAPMPQLFARPGSDTEELLSKARYLDAMEKLEAGTDLQEALKELGEIGAGSRYFSLAQEAINENSEPSPMLLQGGAETTETAPVPLPKQSLLEKTLKDEEHK